MSEQDALFTLHQGLLREAPGSDASTLKAIGMTKLEGDLEVVDMGAGPGASTLVLLRALPQSRVTALDLHPPYLDTVETRVAAAGLSGRLQTRIADMASPGLENGTLDLIWAEGSLYFLGVEAGLRRWIPLLKPGGRIAFSEAIWITKTRPKPVADFWMEYPDMTNRAGVIARVEAAGCRVVDHFVLPLEDWRTYLGPLGTRAQKLRPGADATLRKVLDGAEREGKLFDRYGDRYGYAFFVVEPV